MRLNPGEWHTFADGGICCVVAREHQLDRATREVVYRAHAQIKMGSITIEARDSFFRNTNFDAAKDHARLCAAAIRAACEKEAANG